jgi:hypothetical protein
MGGILLLPGKKETGSWQKGVTFFETPPFD